MPRKRQRTSYEATVEKRRQRAVRRGVEISRHDLLRAPGHPVRCLCYDCLFPPPDMEYRPRERRFLRGR